MPEEYLFVYGTLKRGYERHFVLRDQCFCGPATTVTRCCLYDCGEWPALVECSDGRSIRGELYRVSTQCLEGCDEVEGVAAGQYERRRVDLTIGEPASFRVLSAWCYFYLLSTAGMPDCGDEWPV